MSNVWSDEKKIQWVLDETHRNQGLAPVDIDRFWAEQDIAIADPFGETIAQAPCGVLMSTECVFDELGIPEDYWRYEHDAAWRLSLNQAYNDLAKSIVGRRLLDETVPDQSTRWPSFKSLADIFEAQNIWKPGTWSWWLTQSANSEDELRQLLDRVEDRLTDLRSFLLPENWDQEKSRLTALGVPAPRYRGQRGPVTFATSVYGVENLLFLIADNPDLAERFRDTILRSMIGIADLLDSEAGDSLESAPHGFYFADDNSCLLNPRMYAFFGFPILKAIFERYSPLPGDARFQHSDSAMGHLLPLLGELKMTSVNFGPTLSLSEIRDHLPQAVIYGQLAPFTMSRNESERILAEFLRDYACARDKRGWVFATAGSMNNGSRLTGMRLIMSAIQQFGRYDH